MICRSRLRVLISILLSLCLVSMSMWTYGADATTDSATDEVALVHVLSLDDLSDHVPFDQSCNHGCHAQFHLTGVRIESGPLFVGLTINQDYPRDFFSAQIPSQPGEGPYRPPRIPFQA